MTKYRNFLEDCRGQPEPMEMNKWRIELQFGCVVLRPSIFPVIKLPNAIITGGERNKIIWDEFQNLEFSSTLTKIYLSASLTPSNVYTLSRYIYLLPLHRFSHSHTHILSYTFFAPSTCSNPNPASSALWFCSSYYPAINLVLSKLHLPSRGFQPNFQATEPRPRPVLVWASCSPNLKKAHVSLGDLPLKAQTQSTIDKL